jgi:16S rRNA (uracil1498-N3)-methyltransferase|tara:strand:- start:337 stop:1086 length:750 start_codon:yes stop_codon:yes gene_type:complete
VTAHTPRLFTNHRLDIGHKVTLSDKTANHIQHVLRSKPGDHLILFNGEGGEYVSNIVTSSRNKIEVEVVRFDPVSRESKLNILLGIGILKREAMKTALQKATELGATAIVPVETRNTSVTRAQFDKRRETWLQVIQSAGEQSGRTLLPTLYEAHKFDQWIKLAKGDLKLLTSPGADGGLNLIDQVPQSVCLMIGPEGGITLDEEQIALDAGFVLVSLGNRILRAETVPTALLSLLQYRWGDFQGEQSVY